MTVAVVTEVCSAGGVIGTKTLRAIGDSVSSGRCFSVAVVGGRLGIGDRATDYRACGKARNTCANARAVAAVPAIISAAIAVVAPAKMMAAVAAELRLFDLCTGRGNAGERSHGGGEGARRRCDHKTECCSSYAADHDMSHIHLYVAGFPAD